MQARVQSRLVFSRPEESLHATFQAARDGRQRSRYNDPGSGTLPHVDADEYFWVPSTPPYLEKRPEDERLELMRTVVVPREPRPSAEDGATYAAWRETRS